MAEVVPAAKLLTLKESNPCALSATSNGLGVVVVVIAPPGLVWQLLQLPPLVAYAEATPANAMAMRQASNATFDLLKVVYIK